MEKRGQARKLDILGKRILNASRTELILAMRFLAAPLDALSYVMDLTTTSVGTDAVYIRFHPNFLFQLYTEEPARLNRTYLHMLLHCLFGHMFASERFAEEELWNLAADIATEAVIDSMETDGIRRVTSDYRESVYETLRQEISVLTAEKIYHHFLSQTERDYDEEEHMAREFHADDHGFWKRPREEKDDREEDRQQETPPLPLLNAAQLRLVEEQWKKDAARVQSELDLLSKEASKETGALYWTLSLQTQKHTDFRAYLRRFAVVREEARPDPDSFDMGLYYYGLEHYGNLPLIEELEIREAKKIDALVIAIDTSASTAGAQVKRFLTEAAGILRQQESFFHRVDVRIIECDDRVQRELRFTDVQEIERYAEAFTVQGGYGTDFRPVFAHIADERARGGLKNLRALLYFTDGYGVYPDTAPPYETAFLFVRDADHSTRDVPSWALKVYM
ncbi:MAG: metallopeptidase [Lachnospiraceae bacterium]|nr:metallopeptidase [Lachnospiraceae bacterium]